MPPELYRKYVNQVKICRFQQYRYSVWINQQLCYHPN